MIIRQPSADRMWQAWLPLLSHPQMAKKGRRGLLEKDKEGESSNKRSRTETPREIAQFLRKGGRLTDLVQGGMSEFHAGKREMTSISSLLRYTIPPFVDYHQLLRNFPLISTTPPMEFVLCSSSSSPSSPKLRARLRGVIGLPFMTASHSQLPKAPTAI